MNILRLSATLLTGTCLWAGYQFTYTDSLSSISSSKWAQIGTLSAGSNGITGNGSLISTAAMPTGNDYDVRVTIQTANPGPCTGSYSLYARSTPDNSTSYVLNITGTTMGLYRVAANSWTLLSWLPNYCSNGTVMRLLVRGSAITYWSGPNSATYQDSSPIVAGQPGVGISSSTGDTIGNVQIGPVDYVAPAAINASTVETSTAPNRVDLRWPAAAADANSIGLQGYLVYRDGVYLGSPLTPNWLDQTVTGGETTTYAIYAADQHGTLSTPASVTVTVPEGIGATSTSAMEAQLRRPTPKTTPVPSGPSVDQREVGVRTTGAYWGAAGENIDLLSGNLNFSIPLMRAMGRGNSSVSFVLSYNSQMWRQDSSIHLLGEDVGLGIGWTLQAGSILPIWYNGTPLYYLYTDSTGAQYVLDQNNGGIWTSEWGIYVSFDANLGFLHFPDGSFWNMNVQSGSSEQDSGTLYPSQMEDSNGNFITLTYGPAVGYPY